MNVSLSTSFTIDEGLGKDTTVTLRTKEVSNMMIYLDGPSTFKETKSVSQADMLSLTVNGLTKVCMKSIHCPLKLLENVCQILIQFVYERAVSSLFPIYIVCPHLIK